MEVIIWILAGWAGVVILQRNEFLFEDRDFGLKEIFWCIVGGVILLGLALIIAFSFGLYRWWRQRRWQKHGIWD